MRRVRRVVPSRFHMTLPATKAQQIASEYLPRLAANESMDDLTARRAIREAEAAIADSTLEERAAMFQVVGIAYLRLRKHAQAVAAFRNAVRYAPLVKHQTNLAACLTDMGQLGEAWSVLANLRAEEPHDAFVLELTRASVRRLMGDNVAALDIVRRAIERLEHPNAEEAFMLASQHAALGLDDDAVEWLGRSAALARGVAADDTPSLDLVATAPESFHQRLAELPWLARSVELVQSSLLASDVLSIPELTTAQLNHLERLVENPPEPTEALRALVRGRRA